MVVAAPAGKRLLAVTSDVLKGARRLWRVWRRRFT
jgi:hypothetical protein